VPLKAVHVNNGDLVDLCCHVFFVILLRQESDLESQGAALAQDIDRRSGELGASLRTMPDRGPATAPALDAEIGDMSRCTAAEQPVALGGPAAAASGADGRPDEEEQTGRVLSAPDEPPVAGEPLAALSAAHRTTSPR
jgi:hypothetical protein